jgi:hypothetical protein
MKTEVIMKRELFGMDISQRSKSEMFSATDLVRAGNKWRALEGLPLFQMSDWLQQKSTKAFTVELEKEFGKVKISGRGRGHHTWVHPLLFIDMALAISPTLKIQVYQWLYDSLLENRNSSGDSYKQMSGVLFVHAENKAMFPKHMQALARRIKDICKVLDWEHATEDQLKLRDRIHYNISIIGNVLRRNDKSIEYGIKEALKF